MEIPPNKDRHVRWISYTKLQEIGMPYGGFDWLTGCLDTELDGWLVFGMFIRCLDAWLSGFCVYLFFGYMNGYLLVSWVGWMYTYMTLRMAASQFLRWLINEGAMGWLFVNRNCISCCYLKRMVGKNWNVLIQCFPNKFSRIRKVPHIFRGSSRKRGTHS